MEYMMITDYNAKELKNSQLRKATENINKIGNSVRQNYFKVASIIARVEAYKSYEDDGFKSVHEWTAQCFGFKKSTSYSLLRIGKYDTQEVLDEKGRVVDYISARTDIHDNSFGITQLERMSSLDEGEKERLIADGCITADMSCKDIADTVKKFRTRDSSRSENGSTDDTDTMPEFFDIIIKFKKGKSFTVAAGVPYGCKDDLVIAIGDLVDTTVNRWEE